MEINREQSNDDIDTSNTNTLDDSIRDSSTPEMQTTDSIPPTRSLRSEAWNHFERKMIDGSLKAICNYCQKKLGGGPNDGIYHLREHWKRCLYRTTKDIKQILTSASSSKLMKGSPNLALHAFNPEVSRKDLAAMIILHEYPLSMVDHTGFRIFCHNLQPLFKMVTRNTVKKDILKIYRLEKTKVMSLLDQIKSRVSITTDMCTSSNQKKHYMVVTAHYIDDDWVLRNCILRFVYMPAPNTSDVLCDKLMETLLDWNIDRKLSTLTVDNCSTNDSMISKMKSKIDRGALILGGQLFHMRCAAHILNLIVKEGLSKFESGIENMRDSVVFWMSSPKRIEKFEETARQLNIACTKKLVLDCKTRWNSTYLMLNTALEYRDAFFRLKQHDSQYTCLPSEEDWEIASELCKRLENFYNVNVLFSGMKYPTANPFFYEDH